jgi:hypothetical protein
VLIRQAASGVHLENPADSSILATGHPIVMRRLSLFLLVPIVAAGCSKPDKPSIYSPDPSLKIPALKSETLHDAKALRQMVRDLDSDDPAVRFYTIEKLRELTGNTLGYRYYDDELRRKPALKNWQHWLAEQEGTTQPAATTAGSQ